MPINNREWRIFRVYPVQKNCQRQRFRQAMIDRPWSSWRDGVEDGPIGN